jgi:hypothetical protein
VTLTKSAPRIITVRECKSDNSQEKKEEKEQHKATVLSAAQQHHTMMCGNIGHRPSFVQY